MQINKTKIFNTKNLEAGVFLLMGGYKTITDYRNVDNEHKQRILLNDTVVLTASSLGMLGYRALGRNQKVRNEIFKPAVEVINKQFQKFANSDFSKKHLVGKFDNLYHPLQAPLEMSKNIIGSTLSNTLMVASGLFAAILADYGLTKTGFGIHKLKNIMDKDKVKEQEFKQLKQVESFMNKNVDNVFNKEVRKEMFSRVTDMPAFSLLTKSFIGLEGLAITDSEKTSKQVKNATKYLLVNSLVPLFFLSASSALTKKLKNIYRFPIMFASLVGGTLLVKKAVDLKDKN